MDKRGKPTSARKRRIDFETRLLVKLSNFLSSFHPADFSRYKDDYSYSETQFRSARLAYERFFKLYGSFADKSIVDIGCGEGGKTRFYADLNPKTIIGTDLDMPSMVHARAFQKTRNPNNPALHFIAGNGANSPFKSDQFDLCMSEDSFEHFPEPERILNEANRILKPGGRFLILFDPYFGPLGSHLYNWIRLPWAHAIFCDEAMTGAARIIANRPPLPGVACRESPIDQVEREIRVFEHFTNRITLREFKKYLLRSADWKLVCLYTHPTNRLFYPFVHLPVVCEMFVSVFCVLEKAPGQRIVRKDLLNPRKRTLSDSRPRS